MRTFDTSIRASAFWLAVIIPPVIYWLLVQFVAYQAGDGIVPLVRFWMLIALANGLPLAALGWMLFSVVAYTITPGKLIEHRVMGDREFTFGPHLAVAQLANGDIAVTLPKHTLRLRVTEPALCLSVLREAEVAARDEARRKGNSN